MPVAIVRPDAVAVPALALARVLITGECTCIITRDGNGAFLARIAEVRGCYRKSGALLRFCVVSGAEDQVRD